MDVTAEEFFRGKKVEGTRSDALKRITAIVSYAEEGRIMAQYADALIAFWDGSSRGTSNMISNAEKYNLPVRIINC